jgi:hypothetical protein
MSDKPKGDTATVVRVPTPANSPARTRIGRSRGGIGHNLPQEAPEPFAEAVLEVAG